MRMHFRLKHRGRLCCLLCFQGLCAGDILKWSCLHRSPALTPLKPPLCEEQPIRRKLPWRMGCAKGQDKIKKDYFVTHAKQLRMSRLTCTQTNKFIVRSKKQTDTDALMFFYFSELFFHPAAYLRWFSSNIWCVFIWRCVRKGANISKHKERARDFRFDKHVATRWRSPSSWACVAS